MKKIFRRVGLVILALTMLVSMSVTSFAAEKEAPTKVANVTSGNSYRLYYQLSFNDADEWLNSITEISTENNDYTRVDAPDRSVRYQNYIWTVSNAVLYISDEKESSIQFTIKADGYNDIVIDMGTRTYNSAYGTYSYEGVSIQEVQDEESEPEPLKSISMDQVTVGTDYFGNDWQLVFNGADDYVKGITSVTVNGESWDAYITSPSSGGKYYANEGDNMLVFAKNNFGSTPVLKSGDVISIENSIYETLAFKIVIDSSNNMTLNDDDGKGDPYNLYLKLEGSFESAIQNQKDYDAVTSASIALSTNDSSSVKIYSAIVEGNRPDDDSEVWTELNLDSNLEVETNSAKVNIVPDENAGTSADNDSGMTGVYTRISSAVTITGTPKDTGKYLVSVTLSDTQGRNATSNSIPFIIYSGDETLSERLVYENLTPTEWDGKYMWKNMEPWSITYFGSNVDGEDEAVRVPEKVKAWYGSSESGTYGNLGYAIEWSDVESGEIPQTLYIPADCDLTLVNMEIQSSVRIVIEDGGKLTLRDSVVQGIIDVKSGGTFSMNYNGFGDEPEFLTGASVDGQIHLEDGAILENAAIYSHTNYIANGDADTRNHNAPVVTATGNVAVKGQVFINGDESGTKGGQVGLLVQKGTVTLEDDAVLAVFGGDAKVTLYHDAGDAIVLDNGNITGNGKLIAIGGAPLWGNGGDAVSGNGTISTNEAFLQGATAKSDSPIGNKNPGKATNELNGKITVSSPYQHKQDGAQITIDEGNHIEGGDPLYDLYWKTGIEPTPDLSKYPTEKVENPGTGEDDKKDDDADEGILRIYGSTRYITAMKNADKLKELQGGEAFNTVVLTSGENAPDALSASYLASINDAPLLLINSKNAATVKTYIKENLSTDGKIIIIGGTKAVSESWLNGLTGYTTDRIAGNTRYETNLKVLEKIGYDGGNIFVATGTNYADSLSGSALDMPILLVNGNSILTDEQIDFLSGNEAKMYIAGGTNAISKNMEQSLKSYGEIVKRFAGQSRYETSKLIAEEFFSDSKLAVLAAGNSFPDGLSAGPLASELRAPILLTNDESMSESAVEYTKAKEITNGIIIGGPSLISDETAKKIFGEKSIQIY